MKSRSRLTLFSLSLIALTYQISFHFSSSHSAFPSNTLDSTVNGIFLPEGGPVIYGINKVLHMLYDFVNITQLTATFSGIVSLLMLLLVAIVFFG